MDDRLTDNFALGHLAIETNYGWEDETVEDELRYALLDRLRLSSPIIAADRAFIIDVRSASELFAMECAIISTHGNEEIRSVADVDIRIGTITSMRSPPTDEWFQQKQFDYVHIANSARLTRNRRKLLHRAFECLAPEGFFDVQDFDLTIRCDDNTFPENDSARHLFNNNMDAANVGHPLCNVFRYGSKMKGIALQTLELDVHKAPTNPWLVGRDTECLVRIAERVIVRDLESWCKDTMEDDCLSPEMIMDCAMARQSFRDSNKHSYFD